MDAGQKFAVWFCIVWAIVLAVVAVCQALGPDPFSSLLLFLGVAMFASFGWWTYHEGEL